MAQGSRKYLAKLITEFVNRDPKDARTLPQVFIEKYGVPRYRFGAKEVLWVAGAFRQAWDKNQKDAFAQNIEQVFADRMDETFEESDRLGGRFDAELSKYIHPAFRVIPGRRGPVFSPRDPLDRMALELLRAYSSNRLRVCGRSDNGCPTPLFVAYHAKQKYCYRGCDKQALSDWRADWWSKRKQKKSSSRKEK